MNKKIIVVLFTIMLASLSLYSLLQVLDKEVWRILFAAIGLLVFSTFSVILMRTTNE